MDNIFDITHWLTSENNKLHSTAITFFGLTWIEIVFILLKYYDLKILSAHSRVSTVMARGIFVMPIVPY